MSLQSLIREGDYASAQEAFDAITAPSVTVTDDQKYTWAGVADIIGPEATEGLRVKFDTSGFGWVSLQLGGLGIPLSDSRVQEVLLGFAQLGAAGCSALAARGISQKAPWQVDGIATEPTLEQVTEAFDAELRYRAYQSIVERATAATEAAAEAYRSPTPTPQEITTAGEQAFEVV